MNTTPFHLQVLYKCVHYVSETNAVIPSEAPGGLNLGERCIRACPDRRLIKNGLQRVWESSISLCNAVSPPTCTRCIIHNRIRAAYTGDGDAWLPWLHSKRFIYNNCDVLYLEKYIISLMNCVDQVYVCTLENGLYPDSEHSGWL